MICPQCKYCWDDGEGTHCPECVRPKDGDDQEEEIKEGPAYTLLTRDEMERSAAGAKQEEEPVSEEVKALTMQLNARLDNLEGIIKNFYSNKNDTEHPDAMDKWTSDLHPYSIPAGLLTGGCDQGNNEISRPNNDSDNEDEPVSIWEGGVRRPTTLRRFDLRRFLPASERNRPLHFENTMHLVSPYMSLVMELTSDGIDTHGVLSHLTFILELAARNLYTTEEMVEYDRRMRDRANRDGIRVFVEGEPLLANRCFRDGGNGDSEGAVGGASAAAKSSSGASRHRRGRRRGHRHGGHRGGYYGGNHGYSGGYRGSHQGGQRGGYRGGHRSGNYGDNRGGYHRGNHSGNYGGCYGGHHGDNRGCYHSGNYGGNHGGYYSNQGRYQGNPHRGYHGLYKSARYGGHRGAYHDSNYGGYHGGQQGAYHGAYYEGNYGRYHGGQRGAYRGGYQGRYQGPYHGGQQASYHGNKHGGYQSGYHDGNVGNHGGYHGNNYGEHHSAYGGTSSGRHVFTGWRRLAAERRVCFSYCQGRPCHGCRFRHVCTHCNSINHTMFNCPGRQGGGRL